MIDIKKLFPLLHPLLFAIYPPLALLAYNRGEILFSDASRSIGIIFSSALIIFLLLGLIGKNWGKAALLCTGGWLLFFSYGHIYSAVKTWEIAGFLPGRHRYMLPLWGLLLVLWSLWVVMRAKKEREFGTALTVVGVIALAMPVYSVFTYYLMPSKDISHAPMDGIGISTRAGGTAVGERPDIYYIILDGYARTDTLKELYDYDNSGFIEFLMDKGFYVAEKSSSNYAQTALSLSSSLNMEYVNYMTEEMGVASEDRRPLERMVQHSRVSEGLREAGYQYVVFESGVLLTEVRDADLYLAPDYTEAMQEYALLSGLSMNEFEGLLLETTVGCVFFDWRLGQQNEARAQITNFPYQKQRTRILFTMSKLGEIPKMDGDFFVFAHIIAPHPPFVFGSQGEEVENIGSYSFQDAGRVKKVIYIPAYRDQLAYLSQLAKLTIDEILSQSTTPPIIILQADHGPAAYLNWASAEDSILKERFNILNAYYFPGINTEEVLYPTITPVNSYRILFNLYFGAHYDLLPDRSYFSSWWSPYDFLDVTEEVNQ